MKKLFHRHGLLCIFQNFLHFGHALNKNQNNEDIEKFTEWLNDFETTDYIGRSAYITTLEGEKQYFEENLNKNYNFFIITLKEDKLIGTVGLENYDFINRTATLGIFIGDKGYRNEGYGTEAFSARIKYAFDVLGLRRIENGYFVNNEKSKRMQEKLGYRNEGLRRKKYLCLATNEYVNECITGLLKEEFIEWKGNN